MQKNLHIIGSNYTLSKTGKTSPSQEKWKVSVKELEGNLRGFQGFKSHKSVQL